MSIAVYCATCEVKLNAPDAAAGKRVKCPKCGKFLIVPMPRDDFEEIEDEPKQKVKRKPRYEEDDEDEDRPRPARKRKPVARDDEDDDDEPRPRKKRKKAPEPKSNALPFIIGGGVLGLALVGFLVYWFALRTPEAGMGLNPNSTGDPGGLETLESQRPATPPAGWKLVEHPEFSAWFTEKGSLTHSSFDRLPLPPGFPYPFGTRMVKLETAGSPTLRPLAVFVVPLRPEQKEKATANLGELFKTIFATEFFDPRVPNVAFKEAKLDGKPAVEWSEIQGSRTTHFLGAVANDRAYVLVVGGQNVTTDDVTLKTFRRSFRFGVDVPVPKPPEKSQR